MTSPEDLLGEAKTLAENPVRNDARRRTIIGRAYYAAYHCALAHQAAEAFSFSPDRRNARQRHIGRHQQLIEHLRASPSKVVRRVAESLLELKEWRTAADYHLDSPIPLQQEQTCLDLAEEIILEDLA